MTDRPAAVAAPVAPVLVHRADYRPPAWLIDDVALDIALDPLATTVASELRVRRNPDGDGGPLRLDGEALELVSVAVDGVPVEAARMTSRDDALVLRDLPERCTVAITVRHAPDRNTELSGLYRSNGTYVTQCEAEGFRRITFFPDRPDVMARYAVTLHADRAACPVLLSNGNPDGEGEEADGRHWARWVDPHPKPSYLFALVAGDLRPVRERFRTRSGRDVALAIWVRDGDQDRCGFAMRALVRSMEWDEERYGLEYDLDVFNVVAVSDFNAGAMENKGLNIFNTRLVLADERRATDEEVLSVERVIAHEYFHNWTGDRITCRDWFQLTLKEGLTVYRDQEFMYDERGRATKRIADARLLRERQFPEDSGPLAHPVRPDSYAEINNFYTTTVYEKGAEVVRMIERMVGRDAFRRGMDRYVARHDNQAVTCEDFVLAMEDASGADLGQFRRWYSTAGTPLVTASWQHDAPSRTLALTLRQELPGRPDAAPLLIPIALGLVGTDGAAIAPHADNATPVAHAGDAPGTALVLLDERERTVRFTDVPGSAVPSLNRGFSAPVRIAGLDRGALAVLAAHDPDPFVRWDAGQRHAASVLLEAVAARAAGGGAASSLDPAVLDPALVASAEAALRLADRDPAYAAASLLLPSEVELGEEMAVIDVDGLHAVRRGVVAAIGRALAPALRDTFGRLDGRGPATDDGARGRRALRDRCLALLTASGAADAAALATAQFDAARNLTDQLGALRALDESDDDAAWAAALDRFRAQWRDEPLVLDRWFALQAGSSRADTPATVRTLLADPAFSLGNPNRVYALLGVFGRNQARFHDRSGAGYRLLGELVGRLDGINRSVAARLVDPLMTLRRHEPERRATMRAELERLAGRPGLSRGVGEKVAAALA